MWRKEIYLLVGGTIILLGLSAIAGKFALSNAAETPSAEIRQTASAEKPRRIISVDNKGDEMILALVAPERIAALSPNADNPTMSNVLDEAKQVALRTDAQIEKILSLQPDLVITGFFTPVDVKIALKKYGVTMVELNRAFTIEEIQQNVAMLGAAVGEPERAAAIVAEMNQTLGTLRELTRDAPKPRALYMVSGRAITSGKGTHMDELMQAAGATNAAAEAGITLWGGISIEKVVAMNPDVIFIPENSDFIHVIGNARDVFTTPELASDPAWRDVSAVKNKRVYAMRNGMLSCSSHLNVRTAEAMARVLHPEIFASRPTIAR